MQGPITSSLSTDHIARPDGAAGLQQDVCKRAVSHCIKTLPRLLNACSALCMFIAELERAPCPWCTQQSRKQTSSSSESSSDDSSDNSAAATAAGVAFVGFSSSLDSSSDDSSSLLVSALAAAAGVAAYCIKVTAEYGCSAKPVSCQASKTA